MDILINDVRADKSDLFVVDVNESESSKQLITTLVCALL